MQKLLKGIDANHLRLVRRFSGGIRHKQYQVVAVDGVLSAEEKIVSIPKNPQNVCIV